MFIFLCSSKTLLITRCVCQVNIVNICIIWCPWLWSVTITFISNTPLPSMYIQAGEVTWLPAESITIHKNTGEGVVFNTRQGTMLTIV